LLKRILWVALLSTLMSVASAQDFYRRPSPFAGRTILTLALFEEVRAELKTTPENNKAIDDMVGKLGGEIQDAFQNSGGDFGAMAAAIDKINAKYDEDGLKLLSAEQGVRLKQLFVQYNGASALGNPIIAKDLAVTDEQQGKIKALRDDQRQKMMGLFQQGASQDEMVKSLQKIQEELNAGIEKVLTDEQRKSLKDAEGAKFEFKVVGPAG